MAACCSFRFVQSSDRYTVIRFPESSPTKLTTPDGTLLLEAWRSFYLMQFADCGNGYSLSRCRVINDILTGPELRERLDTRFCSIEGLRCLYETQLSVVEHIADHIEDAEGLAREDKCVAIWATLGREGKGARLRVGQLTSATVN